MKETFILFIYKLNNLLLINKYFFYLFFFSLQGFSKLREFINLIIFPIEIIKQII
jgi:hypothetical protein